MNYMTELNSWSNYYIKFVKINNSSVLHMNTHIDLNIMIS